MWKILLIIVVIIIIAFAVYWYLTSGPKYKLSATKVNDGVKVFWEGPKQKYTYKYGKESGKLTESGTTDEPSFMIKDKSPCFEYYISLDGDVEQELTLNKLPKPVNIKVI